MVRETRVQSQVILKTLKMVLDTYLLNTQHYKACIKVSGAILGKELHPPLHLGVVAIEKGAFGSSQLQLSTTLLFKHSYAV